MQDTVGSPIAKHRSWRQRVSHRGIWTWLSKLCEEWLALGLELRYGIWKNHSAKLF